MSYTNQELTEHLQNHKMPVEGCDLCDVDLEIKALAKTWESVAQIIKESW
ncbi:MAG TPA: hypothetical protein VGO47_08940 [Chlamydiales bacterium]|nr:hypothetical protein [Chlamydiales bacterium]